MQKVGAAAAVLIASAAAELKRQKAEQEVQTNSGGGDGDEDIFSDATPPTSQTTEPTTAADVDKLAEALQTGLEVPLPDAQPLSTSSTAEVVAVPTAVAATAEEKSVLRTPPAPPQQEDGLSSPNGSQSKAVGNAGGNGVGEYGVTSVNIEGIKAPRQATAGGRGGGSGPVASPASKSPPLVVTAAMKSPSERWRDGISGLGPGFGSGVSTDGSDPGAFGVQCFTCTVGKKPSQAWTYVNDMEEVSVFGACRGQGCWVSEGLGSGGFGGQGCVVCGVDVWMMWFGIRGGGLEFANMGWSLTPTR